MAPRLHRRRCGGAPGGIRTPGLLIRSQTLYPLSYGRAVCAQASTWCPRDPSTALAQRNMVRPSDYFRGRPITVPGSLARTNLPPASGVALDASRFRRQIRAVGLSPRTEPSYLGSVQALARFLAEGAVTAGCVAGERHTRELVDIKPPTPRVSRGRFRWTSHATPMRVPCGETQWFRISWSACTPERRGPIAALW